MTVFSIKDLADFSGIKPHTIRIWEQRFTFLQPKRNESLRRLYTTEELNVFLDVSLLNHSGYKVSRIARMSPGEKAEVMSRIDPVQRHPKAVNDLIICMAEMDAEGFERVLNESIHASGIHETIEKVVVPFADKVGLFEKGENKSYIENMLLIKEIIKQKLYFGMEKVVPEWTRNQSVIVFLPQGEEQELSLLYLTYQLKKKGLKVIYLGGHSGPENLELICEAKKPNYLVTHIAEKKIRADLARFLAEVPRSFPQTKFISIGHVPGLVQNNTYRPVKDVSEALARLLEKV
jgi:DNA-binding transcriptional MerR regulator